MRKSKKPKSKVNGIPILKWFGSRSLFTLAGAQCFYWYSRIEARIDSSIDSFNRSILVKVFSRETGLCHYSEIGKPARDLLYSDYLRGLKLNIIIDPFSANLTLGNDVPTLGFISDVPTLGYISSRGSYRTVNSQFEVGLPRRLLITSTVDPIAHLFAPGLSGIVTLGSEQNSSKIDLQYIHHNSNANFRMSMGLFLNPMLGFSGIIGNKFWSFGAEGSFNVITHNLETLDVGCTAQSFTLSFIRCQMTNLLKLSYHQQIDNFAVANEMFHNFGTSTNNQLSIGLEYSFDKEKSIKARVDSCGNVAGVFKYFLTPKSFVSFSVEKQDRLTFGLSVSLILDKNLFLSLVYILYILEYLCY